LDYLEGQLDTNTRARFEEHLTVCADCVRYLSQYRAALRAGRGAFDELPATVPEGLVRAILDAQKAC